MSQKVLWWIVVAAVALAVLLPDAFAYYGLVLVLIGLVGGFMAPIEDVATRVAYYVLAAALPGIADQMDLIPVVGTYLNGFLDNLAVFLAGIAIASVLIATYNNVIAAGDN